MALLIHHLQQFEPLVTCPSFVISTDYDSILITNGNKYSSVFQFNGHDEYIKTDGIRLTSSRILSLSHALNSWVIACTISGDVLAIEWKSIMGIKTPPVEDYSKIDIFTSLLNDGINPKLPKFPKLYTEISDFSLLDSVPLGVLQNVKSAYLVDGILIAFSIEAEQCCTLNIWKPKQTAVSNYTLPSFSHQPSTVITHNSTSSNHSNNHNYTIPFLAVNLEQAREGIVTLTSDLFNYLFGCEETLSHSVMIVYGCHCGLVFGYSIKRLSSKKQTLLSCLDQPILSIYPLSFSKETQQSVYDSLMFIGRLGKIILIKSNPSISTQEIITSGPLFSSLLIPQKFLLLSTLTAVQLICLKCHNDNHTSLLITLFEQPLTVLYSPYYLLSYNKGKNHFFIFGIRPEGQLCSIKLPFELKDILQSDINISSRLKETLDSIESSSDALKQLDTEIATINSDLLTLNEVSSLFGDHLDRSLENPLILELSIIYEQLDALARQPFLNVRIFLSKERVPLKKGCFLSIMMLPTLSNISHDTYSFSLEGLTINNPLNLKLTISQNILTHFRFKVICCLSFSFLSSHTRKCSPSIPLIDKTLSLINFIQPLNSCDANLDTIPVTVIKIDHFAVQSYLRNFQNESSSSTSSPLFLLFIKLFEMIDVSKHLTSVKDCHGNCGFEFFGILPDNSFVRIRLMEETTADEEELRYILSIVSTCSLHSTEIAEIISQMLKL